jgi:hypothetical protein
MPLFCARLALLWDIDLDLINIILWDYIVKEFKKFLELG